MDIDDGTLRAAMAFHMYSGVSDEVKALLSDIPRAPLALFIGEYLIAKRDESLGQALKSIAALNEGEIDDLDDPRFKSFIVAQTGIAAEILNDCVLRLAAFKLEQRDTSAKNALRFAAREDL